MSLINSRHAHAGTRFYHCRQILVVGSKVHEGNIYSGSAGSQPKSSRQVGSEKTISAGIEHRVRVVHMHVVFFLSFKLKRGVE